MPFLLFFILAFILFSPFFLKGEIFLAADNLYKYYPWKYFAPANFRPHNVLITDPVDQYYAAQYNRQLKEGQFSNWNPYIFAGIPASCSASMGHPGRYYPVKIVLNLLFPAPVASTLLLFIHLFCMGYFMYLYLSLIGAGRRGSLFGAVAYMFNGCVMVWLEFEMWVTVSAWFPLLLFFLEKFLISLRWKFVFSGGMVFGLLVLSDANHQLGLYVCLMSAFYLVFRLITGHAGTGSFKSTALTVAGFMTTGTLGLLIGAVELLPFAELAANSSRITRTLGFHQLFEVMGRVPFRYFITLLFPDFFGNPVLDLNVVPHLDSQQYMNYNELSLYTGLPAVFALIVCLLGRKNGFSRFYLFMAFLSIALMTGTYAYYPFYKLVPGMDKMNPTRFIYLFMFSAAVLSAFGIKLCEDLSGWRRRTVVGVFLLVLSGMVLVGVFSGSGWMTVWFNHEQFRYMTNEWIVEFNELRLLRKLTSPAIYRPLIIAVFSSGFFLIYIFSGDERIRRTGFASLLLLLSYDLISYGRNYNTTVSPEKIYPKTPAIEFLMTQQRPFRVVQDTQHHLSFNTLTPFGIEEAGGYSSLYPIRINRLISAIQGEEKHKGKIFDRWVKIPNFSSPLLDLMNVKYVLTSPGHMLNEQKYKLVFLKDLAVYENRDVMPRAFAVRRHTLKQDVDSVLEYMESSAFDMRREVVLEEEPSAGPLPGNGEALLQQSVTIEGYSPDEVRIRADMPDNGWVVLTDTYYPGWEAEVNGRKANIYRADCNFRAVAVGAGENEIVFRYRPFSVRLGILLTTMGTVSAIAGLFLSRRHNRSAV